ncbi:MAG: hypothetical protein P1P89_18270 [Desulfobacterales bacterium]|nr:hypothetical protein [Desulfobacterales bacterium]
MNENLNIKTIILFFLPLLFMMELIQLSHSITNAFIARLPNPTEVLAAFSIAFALNSTVTGVSMTSIQVGICFITDWTSLIRLFRLFVLLVTATFSIVELTSLTPVGDIVFGEWMGASPEVVSQAKLASAIMGLWSFPILIRNFCYAVVMRNRRTILITYATTVRLVSLFAFLFLFSFWFNGAIVGALATVSGMVVEAVYMIIVARPFFRRLERNIAQPASYGEIWHFSWPLMINQISENGVMFIINFFLGNLANPDLAIASFGVVFGLLKLLLFPFRNLVQATQALVQKREDLRAILQFTAGMVLFYICLNFLMFYTPMRILILDSLMGLTPELSAYSTSAVRLIYIVAIFWATSSLSRGMLAAIRKTGFIGLTAGVRLAVLAAFGVVPFFLPNINGSVLGVIAIAGSFAAEAMVLGWRFHGQTKMPGSLFPSDFTGNS